MFKPLPELNSVNSAYSGRCQIIQVWTCRSILREVEFWNNSPETKLSILSIIWIAYTCITNTILTPKFVCLQASQINFMIQGIHLWLKLNMWIHKHFTVFNIAFSAMGSGLLTPFLIRWHILSEVKTAICESGQKLLISCIHFMETKFICGLSTVSSTTELSRNMQ